MDIKTTTEKAEFILRYSDINTKVALSEELGISRPTLDSRLSGNSEWKKLEIKTINSIYNQFNQK